MSFRVHVLCPLFLRRTECCSLPLNTNPNERHFTNLEEVVADTLEALERGTRREVAGPERVWVAGVGEEVVLFCRKLEPFLVESLQITGGRRVEQVDVAVVSRLSSVHRTAGAIHRVRVQIEIYTIYKVFGKLHEIIG